MKSVEELKTPLGLLAHLADVMIKLDNKKLTTEEAKAQASLVKQSNNLLRYELDVRKFDHKLKTESKTVVIDALVNQELRKDEPYKFD